MRPSLRSFTLTASMLLLLNPPTAFTEPPPAFNFAKRDNTVYVTVTEYRYVPAPAPASAASFAPNPSPQPVLNRQPPVLASAPVASQVPNPLLQQPTGRNQQPAERPAPSNVPQNSIFPAPLASSVINLAPRPNINPIPAAPRPNPNPNAMAPMARPAPITPAAFIPPPTPVSQPVNTPPAPVPAAAWIPPFNDALTYTSYAGLLSTMAPAFYPMPLNPAAVPTRATASPLPQQQPPLPPTPVAHAFTPHTIPTPLMAPTMATGLTLNNPILSSPESVAPTPTLSATSAVPKEKEKESPAAHTTSSSSVESAGISKENTTSLSSTTTNTTTSTTTSRDVTVSTTTTTRGDTTSTRTTVGSDGTTTVLTEYPTSTRRTTTSKSGAEAKWPRTQGGRQDPSVGSVVGYLAGLLIPEAPWSMTATAMIVALALPGAVALLV